MDVVNTEALNELINFRSKYSVSLYMPVEYGTKEARQNPIRLKNLLNQARLLLEEQGARSTEINELLEPASTYIDDIDFWNTPETGLAIFLAPGFSKIFKVPFNFAERVVVNSRFHMKRLIAFYTENQRFYILAVSQSSVRFLDCTRTSCLPLGLEGLPENMDDALGGEYTDTGSTAQSEHASGIKSGKGSGPGIHGQSYMKEDETNKLQQYLNVVAKDLHLRLKDDSTPLVFAGVNNYYPIFRDFNTYPHLVDGFVEGNHENLSDQELHASALHVVGPVLDKAKNEAIHKFKQIKGTTMVTEELKNAAMSAFEGRIDTLIIPIGIQEWGKFDESTGEIKLEKEQRADSQDLLDFTAVHTLKNGGKVYVIKQEEMPNGSNVAAILRF